MPDDRYLDGDPRADEDRFLFTDLSPFVQQTQQECQLLVDLLRAGRLVEAEEIALGRLLRAESALRTLEKPSLPQVDLDQTPDVGIRSDWKYKGQP